MVWQLGALRLIYMHKNLRLVKTGKACKAHLINKFRLMLQTKSQLWTCRCCEMLAADVRSGELGRSQVRDVVLAYLDGHDAK